MHHMYSLQLSALNVLEWCWAPHFSPCEWPCPPILRGGHRSILRLFQRLPRHDQGHRVPFSPCSQVVWRRCLSNQAHCALPCRWRLLLRHATPSKFPSPMDARRRMLDRAVASSWWLCLHPIHTSLNTPLRRASPAIQAPEGLSLSLAFNPLPSPNMMACPPLIMASPPPRPSVRAHGALTRGPY